MQEFRLLRRGERHALLRRRQGHATSASVHEGAVLGGVFQVRVSMYDSAECDATTNDDFREPSRVHCHVRHIAEVK